MHRGLEPHQLNAHDGRAKAVEDNSVTRSALHSVPHFDVGDTEFSHGDTKSTEDFFPSF